MSKIGSKAIIAASLIAMACIVQAAMPSVWAGAQNTEDLKFYFTDSPYDYTAWSQEMGPISNSFGVTNVTPTDATDKAVAAATSNPQAPGVTVFAMTVDREMKISSNVNVHFWVKCDAVSVCLGSTIPITGTPVSHMNIGLYKNGQRINDALTASYVNDELTLMAPGTIVEVNHTFPINNRIVPGDILGVAIGFYGENVKESPTVKYILGSTAHPSCLTIPVNVPKIASKIALTADMSEKYVKPGESVAFTVTAKNNGAENASFNFTANCTSANWTCTLTPEKADVAAGASQNVTLVVSCPASAIKGDKATVKVTAGDTAIELTVTASDITSGGAVTNSIDEKKTPGFEFAFLAVAIVAAVFLMRRK
jgi:hypothetical protein